MRYITGRLLLFATAAMLMLNGCASHRNLTPAGTSETALLPLKQMFDSVEDAHARFSRQFECVALPVKFELRQPSRMSFSGRAYLKADKEIFFSLRKLGFEVAQLAVTPDSIFVVDKFNKQYVAEETTRLSALSGITLSQLTDLLTGQIFRLGNGEPARSDYNLSYADREGQWVAEARHLRSDESGRFTFSGISRLASARFAKDKFVLQADYDYPVATPVGTLPETLILSLATGKIDPELAIGWRWDEAQWNAPEAMRTFAAPTSASGYSRLTISDIAKIFGQQQ